MTSSSSASEARFLQHIQKHDSNPVDEAKAFFGLNELNPGRWTSEALGDIARRSAAYVEQSFRLLELPANVLSDVREGDLTREQALELLHLPTDKLRSKVAREIIHSALTMREIRQLIQGMSQLTRAGERVRRNI